MPSAINNWKILYVFPPHPSNQKRSNVRSKPPEEYEEKYSEKIRVLGIENIFFSQASKEAPSLSDIFTWAAACWDENESRAVNSRSLDWKVSWNKAKSCLSLETDTFAKDLLNVWLFPNLLSPHLGLKDSLYTDVLIVVELAGPRLKFY